MKKRPILWALAGIALAISAVALLRPSAIENVASAQTTAPETAPEGGGTMAYIPEDEITDTQRSEIKLQLQRNIAMLTLQGKLAPASPEATTFSWPVAKAPGVTDFDVDAIGNYVDENPAYPNQVLDWNCGSRTYDTSAGYNHAGVDILSWPFGWKKMDNNEVRVVAAAPGTIIMKADGNFDRNCSMNGTNWNAIYVRHADNSVAWYGHMKSGSLTSKSVGDTVTTGEQLGVVGSSGNSTAPHLHFEVYNASNQLQDPFQGSCNTRTPTSLWAVQQPYYVSRINKLMTGSAAPVMPACPITETPNEKTVFRPGDVIYTSAYYRDQPVGLATQYSVVRPDGSVFVSWSHSTPTMYPGTYWYWSWTLPANSPSGTWKFRASFNSQVYEQTFVVRKGQAFDFDGDGKADPSVYRPSNNAWYLSRSTAGFAAYQFGAAGDVLVPADYTGDGKTDIAVFRPSNGTWYVLRSEDLTFYGAGFGTNGDIPAPGDFDGDGKADMAVYRPGQGTWYLQQSTAGFSAVQFGVAEDMPAVGDFDGDGKADISVFRPSVGNWYRLNSRDGSFFGIHFGQTGDKIVPADYTGDGKTDMAIWRPSTGTWYILRSEDLSFYGAGFGISTDLPVPGDYDGDGKADLGVFRPSNGYFYLQQSSAGFSAIQFGTSGDRPAENSYVY